MISNKDKIISKLVSKNFKLKEDLKYYKESMKSINGILYCIGGPLNDNIDQFTPKQLKTFFQIKAHIL